MDSPIARHNPSAETPAVALNERLTEILKSARAKLSKLLDAETNYALLRRAIPNLTTDEAGIETLRIHCENVADLSLRLGEVLTRQGHELDLETLAYAAILHDIGKMDAGIMEVTNSGEKIDRTTREGQKKMEVIKQHINVSRWVIYQLGYELGIPKGAIRGKVMSGASTHHENLDGSGYLGLPHKDIPLIAQIIRVADTFLAIIENRGYNQDENGWTKTANQAIEIIKANPHQFNSQIAEALARLQPKVSEYFPEQRAA